MSNRYINRWFITTSVLLILSPVVVSNQNIPDRRTLSVEFLPVNTSHFCFLWITDQQSIPLCFAFKQNSNSRNDLFIDKPSKFPDPAPVYGLWDDLFVTNWNETVQFYQLSIDDVIEDSVAIFLTTGVTAGLYYLGAPGIVLIPATVMAHKYFNRLGDYLSNHWESEQEHQSTDSWAGIAASNLVEDSIKFVYFITKMWSVVAVKILYSLNQSRTLPAKSQLFGRYTCFIACTGGAFEVVREIVSCFSHYNWINKRSDELGDYAKEWVHYLQGR